MNKKILFREWLVFYLVFGCMAVIFVNSIFIQTKAKKKLYQEINSAPQMIIVKVEGAVKNPGEYHCLAGTIMKEVLDLAEVLPSADKRKINKKKRIFESSEVIVPKKNSAKKPKKNSNRREKNKIQE